MGLFGSIGKLFGGGGGAKPYTSKYNGIYEDEYSDSLHNRMGATQLGPDSQGRQRYDMSSVGQPVSVSKATSQYDFTPQNQAIAGFKSRVSNPNKYASAKFDFGDAGAIDKVADSQYALGAADVNRQSQGDLESLREAVGTRRPGLLAEAGNTNQRANSEKLARLNAEIRNSAMAQKLQLNKEQQTQQADEDYRGYSANEDNSYRDLMGLNELGNQRTTTEAGLQEQGQNQNDRAMEYMMEMMKSYLGQSNSAAQASNQKSGNALGTIGSLAGIASKFI